MRIVSPGFDPNPTTFLCRLALVSELTSSLPQPVKFPRLKSAHTYTPANSIFASPIANLLSILCIWVEILSSAHAKGGRGREEGGGGRGGGGGGGERALMTSNFARLVVVLRLTVRQTWQLKG